ncbi:MAG: superoxide dismutase family protein [Actinomycetota bacterium]|nr:superoxide dismutase family protein [Actinomycetota bacterium]
MQYRKALATLGVAAVPLMFAGPAQADTQDFTLNELNGSGANASATITNNDDGSLTVSIDGSGFTPNSPHAQHIHGAATGDFFCPPASADKNGDGQVATEEGVPQYGNVMVALTTKGDASADSGLAVERMPVADASGNLSYERTIPASAIPEGIAENVENLHIVQHGLDVNGNDKYDLESLGESVFAKSLGVAGIPEEATNPATCGEVTPSGSVETGAGNTSGTENMPLFALGGAALIGTFGAVAMRRRFAESGIQS